MDSMDRKYRESDRILDKKDQAIDFELVNVGDLVQIFSLDSTTTNPNLRSQ